MCRNGRAVPISEDHKPEKGEERARIERAGGSVIEHKGTFRVVTSTNPTGRTKNARKECQGLGMSRSFGDLWFKVPTRLVEVKPDVKVIPLLPSDECLILVTDGVLDVLTNQDIVDLAMAHWRDPEAAAKNIVRTAFGKTGSEDNLTALVVQFAGSDRSAQASSERQKEETASPEAPEEGGEEFDMFA